MIPRESILASYTVAVDIQATPVMNYAIENTYKNGFVIVNSYDKYRAEVDWQVNEYIPWDVGTVLLCLVIFSLNKQFLLESNHVFTHIIQGRFSSTQVVRVTVSVPVK